jgi:hypothetical protein
MAIQETRWQGEAIIDLKTQTLLQTAKNTGRREFGVDGIADNICKENIVGFQPICGKDMYPTNEDKISKYNF